MSILTQAFHDVLASDPVLAGMLRPYRGLPGVFTSHPVPGDAVPPYVVTVGEVVQLPFDTKQTRGREAVRDVRAYAPADGNPIVVEAIIERVRALLHRRTLSISGFTWTLSNVSGPVALDEPDYYGRAISVTVKAQAA